LKATKINNQNRVKSGGTIKRLIVLSTNPQLTLLR
jgi:hypothetical protein